MQDTPAVLRGLVERRELPSFVCPTCGSFLDAPRDNPDDGRLGRKCAACREWHPLETERSVVNELEQGRPPRHQV
jgi:hypothetical protein